MPVWDVRAKQSNIYTVLTLLEYTTDKDDGMI